MGLTSEDRDYVVDQAVAILKAPDRPERLRVLRERVLAPEQGQGAEPLDEAVYAVVQALEELYPKR